jgi:Ran GTPase-activating protein (RanGAP) involved in mRNA processing and transport
MKVQDSERLAAVLAKCPALVHLDLRSSSYFGAAGYSGAERLGVLAQCTALAHLNLSGSYIGAGAGSLAGVLAQCPGLAHLDLSCNNIEQAGQRDLQECWGSAQS